MRLELLFPNFADLVRTPADVERLNEAILELAVRGQLVPQDPADEPASVLLKRIREDKERALGHHVLISDTTSELDMPLDMEFSLPAGWEWIPFGDAGIINPRNTVDDETVVSFIPMSLIRNGIGSGHESEERKWGEIRKGFTHFADGDVGVAKITPCFQNRKSTVFQGLRNGYGAGTTELHVFRPVARAVLPEYALIFLQSPGFIERGKTRMTGTAGQQRVPREYVESVNFPLPPLAEQRRIVAKVDELFAQTRALAAQLAQAQQQAIVVNGAALHRLERAADAAGVRAAWGTVAGAFDELYDTPASVAALRQAILNLAVRGKLVPQEEGDEPAGVVENGTALFPAPASWRWVRMDSVAQIVSGVTKGRKLDPNETISVPYLRVANVQRGYLDLVVVKEIEIRNSELEKYRLEYGDLLLTEGGDADKLGRAAIWHGQVQDCIHQNHIFRARPKGSEVVSEWLMLYTNSDCGRNYFLDASKQTTNLASINGTQLKRFPVALPPLAEQRRIVAKVEQLMRLCDALEAKLAAGEAVRGEMVGAVLGRGARGEGRRR